MKATEANLLKFLSSRQQLMIPIYQRTYSWSRKECRQLWDDIIRVAVDRDVDAHFVGSIVYIARGIYQATAIPQLLVIDGQQRITTISLLLAALARALRNTDEDLETSPKRIFNYYLVNQDESDELRYKLVLTRSDKDALCSVIDYQDVPAHSNNRIFDNFRFFEKLIQESDLDLDVLYEGIGKLLVVDVSLDYRYDNPQLIFESLNSTGLDLSQADLIRNYILMGLEPDIQEDLYRRFWYPMEQKFGHAEYSTLFDRFVRDYLTIKSEVGTIPVIKQVYREFKSYVQHIRESDIEKIVADVYHYSRYFVRLAFPEQIDDPDIGAYLQDINTLKVDVAYPFLMEVYDDYEHHGRLARDEFIEILAMVESYIIRRAICGIQTNSLNKTFATLKRLIDKDNYLESVKAAFLLQTSYRRFPRDEEFWSEFVIKDIYNLRKRRNYMLSKMENFGRKEFVNIEEYTIEHIMPQNLNLPTEWQTMLGNDWKRIQKQYLHTIGNLTLTGYNSELSDRPFAEKRDMEGGFADSPIRLNRSLATLDTWGEQEINNRTEQIAELALQIWTTPNLPSEILDHYNSTEDAYSPNGQYSLDHFEYLEGEMLQLFQALRTRILNLDASVREEPKKLYIAYKTTTNFVDIVPQKRGLRLSLNMKFDEIDDPKNICKDVTNIGRWGNGDVEFKISGFEYIDYAMELIQQSFEKHTDEILV